MPLLGRAAVAMWWDMAPEWRAEFEAWHATEHFPERMRIPGFLRGSRWASAAGGEGVFVMYELAAYEALASKEYLARLNAPTPWSAKMMPHHRNMVRSLCRVAASFGGGIARAMLTVRLSPGAGASDGLQRHLRDALAKLAAPVTGAHLLVTDAPAHATTEEQRIRGGDAAADWIVLVGAYDATALAEIARTTFARASLTLHGARGESLAAPYELRYAMTPADLGND